MMNMTPQPPPMPADSAKEKRPLGERFAAYLDAVYPRASYQRRCAFALGLLAVGVGLASAPLTPWVEARALWSLLSPVGIMVALRSGFALQRMRQSRRQFGRLRRVAERGDAVTAYLVQANEALFYPGSEAALPCLVLFSFQPEVSGDSAYMHYLARRVFSLKNTQPPDAEGQFVASLTTNERAVPHRRRRLPLSFTDGSIVYCADLWVRRAYLSDPHLTTDALTCLAEPGDVGGIEMVPVWLTGDRHGNRLPTLPSPQHGGGESSSTESGLRL